MIKSTAPLNADLPGNPEFLNRHMASVLPFPAERVTPLGEGFYGKVYLAESAGGDRVVIKASKRAGLAEREARNLDILRSCCSLKVPRIHGCVAAKENCPAELILMEYIEGINGAALADADEPARSKGADRLIEVLGELHSRTRDTFGFPGGPDYLYWRDFYFSRIQDVSRRLQIGSSGCSLPPGMERIARLSYEQYDRIFRGPVNSAVLIHGDFNLWNVLLDRKTLEPSGLIDSMSLCWADRDLELFQLANAGGFRASLLGKYIRQYGSPEDLALKLAFYHFWDDLFHTLHAGWYDQAVYEKTGARLRNQMIRHGLRGD